MAQSFLGCDRDQVFLLPPSVDDWLPADHFARLVIAVVWTSPGFVESG